MKLIRPQDLSNPPNDFSLFTHLFKGPKLFCVIPKVPGGVVLHKLAEPRDAWPWISRFQQQGYNAYMTINIPKADKRIKEEMVTARAIWVEDDTPRTEPRDFPLHPSIIVKSSKSKWHYYWLTETANIAEWELVQLRMVVAYGSDNGAKDISRVMRVPGTTNMKYNPPEECVLYEASGQVWEWEELIKTFVPIPGQKSRENAAPESTGMDINVPQLIQEFRNGTSIAPSMNSLIMHYAWHYSKKKVRQLILDMFDTIPEEIMAEHSRRYYEAKQQIDKFVRTAVDKVYKKNGAVSSGQVQISYREIQPLTGTYLKSPNIPENSVPETLYNAGWAAADYLSLGVEPALLSGLCTVSCLLGKNVLIKHIDDSPYETYCTTGLIIVMETGTRKSEICKIMSKPVRDYERQLQKDWNRVQNTNAAEASLYTNMIKKKEQQLHKQDIAPEDVPKFSAELGHLMNLRDSVQLSKPTIFAEDITEEELIKKMSENNGAMCIMDEDARNVIKNIMGRYSTGATGEGVWIKGLHSTPGTYLKYHRAKDGGTEITLFGPCLNALLFVQQDLALELKKHEVYRTSGLAARLQMYFYPVDTVKQVKNSDRTRLMHLEPMQIYYEILSKLSHRRAEPLQISISESAQERFNEYNQRYGDLIQDDYSRHDFMNKIVTQAVHYSVCMAALDDPEFALAFRSEKAKYVLKRKHANMGCLFGHAISEQLLDTHQILEDLAIVKKAQDFVDSIRKKYKAGLYVDGFCCNSYLYQSFSQLTKDNYIPIIQLLTEKGWLGCSVTSSTRVLNSGINSRSAKPNETVYHLNERGILKMGKVQRYVGEHTELTKKPLSQPANA